MPDDSEQDQPREGEVFIESIADGVRRTVVPRNLAPDEVNKLARAATEWSERGLALFKKEQFKEAAEAFQQSLQRELVLGIPERIAADYGNLGNTYLRLGELRKADVALRAGLTIANDENLTLAASRLSYNLARVGVELGDLSAAQEFADLSVRLFTEVGSEQVVHAKLLLKTIGDYMEEARKQSPQ